MSWLFLRGEGCGVLFSYADMTMLWASSGFLGIFSEKLCVVWHVLYFEENRCLQKNYSCHVVVFDWYSKILWYMDVLVCGAYCKR